MDIGIEPKQWEFECPCGHIWIDCQNTGCPMCSEQVGITAKPHDIKQPNRSARHNSKS